MAVGYFKIIYSHSPRKTYETSRMGMTSGAVPCWEQSSTRTKPRPYKVEQLRFWNSNYGGRIVWNCHRWHAHIAEYLPTDHTFHVVSGHENL
jgi:hypothetical protein